MFACKQAHIDFILKGDETYMSIVERYNKQKNKEIPNRLKALTKTNADNEPIDSIIESHISIRKKLEQEQIVKDVAEEITKEVEKNLKDICK